MSMRYRHLVTATVCLFALSVFSSDYAWFRDSVAGTHCLSFSDSLFLAAADSLCLAGFCDDAREMLAGNIEGCAAVASGPHANRDSLMYHDLLARMLARGDTLETYAVTILAAQELAAGSFYDVAAGVLEDYLKLTNSDDSLVLAVDDWDTGAGQLPLAANKELSKKPVLSWKAGIAGDYYHFDDADTTDSISALYADAESDFSGQAWLGTRIQPSRGPIKEIAPLFTAYTYKLTPSLSCDINDSRKIVQWQTRLFGDKYMAEDFGDSSDNIDARSHLYLSSKFLDFPLYLRIPLEGELRRYRFERDGYASYRHALVSGVLGFESLENGQSVEVQLTQKRETYAGPDRDENLESREVRAIWDGLFDHGYVSINAVLTRERFPLREAGPFPCEQQVSEVLGDATVTPVSALTFAVSAEFMQTHASYAESLGLTFTVDTTAGTVDTAWAVLYNATGSAVGYQLNWPFLRIAPRLRVALTPAFDLEAAFTWEFQHVPAVYAIDGYQIRGGPLYIDDWYSTNEPGLGVSYTGEKITASVKGTWAATRVKPAAQTALWSGDSTGESSQLSFEDNNYTTGISVDFSWCMLDWLTLSSYGDLDFERHLPGTGHSWLTRNALVEMRMEARF